jgi:glycosyltransferase involved in cell wall biosynthesis
MQQKAEELIRSFGIQTVIATGPPFLHLQTVVRLKKNHPALKVLVDLRDPWTDNKSFMGFKNMPADRFAFEQETEKEVMQNADAVTTVADHMTETLRAKTKGRESHFFTITNGYDPSEISLVNENTALTKTKSDKMRFVYTGSLYPSIEYVFIPFADSLVKIRNTNPELYLKLSFDFYGSAATEMREIIEERNLDDIVKMKGWVSSAEIGKEIENADACLLFFAADHAFSMNTKLFEYLARKKPVVLFSNPGETPDFLQQNKLGYAIVPEKAEAELLRIIQLHFSSGLEIDSEFDLTRYSVPAITHQLIRIIEQLKSNQSEQ